MGVHETAHAGAVRRCRSSKVVLAGMGTLTGRVATRGGELRLSPKHNLYAPPLLPVWCMRG